MKLPNKGFCNRKKPAWNKSLFGSFISSDPDTFKADNDGFSHDKSQFIMPYTKAHQYDTG